MWTSLSLGGRPASVASTPHTGASVVPCGRLPSTSWFRSAPGAMKHKERESGLGQQPGALKHAKVVAQSTRAVNAVAVAPTASKFKVKTGASEPLGASPGPRAGKGVNFALFSQHATSVSLVLFDEQANSLGPDIPLEQQGDVWSIFLEDLPHAGILYGYRVDGEGGWETGHRWDPSRVLLDPYAKYIVGRNHFGVRDEFEKFETKLGSQFYGTFDFKSKPFDWGKNYKRPNIPHEDLISYEMPVRGFTASPSSAVPEGKRGTFAGLAEKVDHLVELGINAVELLPVFEYDELEFQRTPNPRDHMTNVWGYSHMNFFAPMSRFAANGGGPLAAAREFKEMVRTLHNNGIEVLLDVVYNHTVEGGDDDPYVVSFRGIDNSVYYITDTTQYVQLLNYSGCGNTVSANHPVTKQMIIDSLRWWVEEYHVDGFRFDLATALCRDTKGNMMDAPPLIREIAKDPVLSQVKLIAEPWDCANYQVGTFPNWEVWGEWNGIYRDTLRKYVKGDAGMKKQLATRLAGSADLYNKDNRKPYHGTNFIVAHDGFTLYDLVAYNNKNNFANGENNNDGTNDHFSWNCGAEGETGDEGVNALRNRQLRNFLTALMLSQGSPMLLCGDEAKATRYGNNNWYGHDSELTWFDWEALERERDGYFRFYSNIVRFRRSNPLLRRTEFLGDSDITWHEDNWDNDESRFLAFTLHDRGQGCGDLYAAFNSHSFGIDAALPAAPAGKQWFRLVDTNLPSPKDFSPDAATLIAGNYMVQPYSSIVLLAKDG